MQPADTMSFLCSGVRLRFRVSAPVDQFTTASNVTGGTAAPGSQGSAGLNVLLHGDGGQSFLDYPNQGVQNNLMGVVVLAPSEQLLWGQRTGQPSGLKRVDGVADAQAVHDLIKKVLPQVVAFNASNIFLTGVSGGSIVLSGYFVPAHMADFAGTGVLLMCGGLVPQVAIKSPESFLGNTKIHYQTTKKEMAMLQTSIPQAIKAYEQAATAAGVTTSQLATLQTVDNTPNGGHCAFDEREYTSGIQLVSNSFANIMQGGDGSVKGMKVQTVLKPVVGNENLVFGTPARQKRDSIL